MKISSGVRAAAIGAAIALIALTAFCGVAAFILLAPKPVELFVVIALLGAAVGFFVSGGEKYGD